MCQVFALAGGCRLFVRFLASRCAPAEKTARGGGTTQHWGQRYMTSVKSGMCPPFSSPGSSLGSICAKLLHLRDSECIGRHRGTISVLRAATAEVRDTGRYPKPLQSNPIQSNPIQSNPSGERWENISEGRAIFYLYFFHSPESSEAARPGASAPGRKPLAFDPPSDSPRGTMPFASPADLKAQNELASPLSPTPGTFPMPPQPLPAAGNNQMQPSQPANLHAAGSAMVCTAKASKPSPTAGGNSMPSHSPATSGGNSVSTQPMSTASGNQTKLPSPRATGGSPMASQPLPNPMLPQQQLQAAGDKAVLPKTSPAVSTPGQPLGVQE